MPRWLRFVTFWLLTAAPLAAQTRPTLAEGDRIRVTYRCMLGDGRPGSCRRNGDRAVFTGTLVAFDSDTLHASSDVSGTTVTVPRSLLVDVQVSRGAKGHFLAGAGIGLVTGVALGAIIGSTQDFCLLTCSPATGIGAVAGAPAGLILGGIAGALIRTDRWAAVDLDRPRLSVTPRPGAIGVMVSIAF